MGWEQAPPPREHLLRGTAVSTLRLGSRGNVVSGLAEAWTRLPGHSGAIHGVGVGLRILGPLSYLSVAGSPGRYCPSPHSFLFNFWEVWTGQAWIVWKAWGRKVWGNRALVLGKQLRCVCGGVGWGRGPRAIRWSGATAGQHGKWVLKVQGKEPPTQEKSQATETLRR